MTSLELIEILLKVTLLLAMACGVALVLRRASAAVRHLVWLIGLGSALFLPMLAPLLPDWQLTLPASILGPLAGAGEGMPAARSGSLDVVAMAVGVWLTGVVAMLLWMLAGNLRLRHQLRSGATSPSREWSESIAAVRLSGIHSAIRLVECTWLDSPCVWGVFRPVVMLPRCGREWTAAERRYAIIHEVSHIQRGDLIANLVARIACAVHWYHPLAWFAARAARLAREEACDNAVLAGDAIPADYASLLLSLATRGAVTSSPLVPALELGHRSELGTRLRALFDDSISKAPIGRGGVLLATGLGIGLLSGVATIALGQRGPLDERGTVGAAAKRICAEGRAGSGGRFAITLRDSTGTTKRYTLAVRCNKAT